MIARRAGAPGRPGGVPARGRRPVSRTALAGAVALCAALVAGCDGGLFGTGRESASDADAGPLGTSAAPPTDAADTGAGGGSAPEATDAPPEPQAGDAGGDASPGESPPFGVTGEATPGASGTSVFVNDRPTHGGPDPLLRAVNLTRGAVRIAASGGTTDPIDVAAGAVAPVAALAGPVDALVATDPLTLEPLARTEVRLAPGTLTLLLVVSDTVGGGAEAGDGSGAGDDGTLAVPFAAEAGGPDGGVAAVRALRVLPAAANGAVAPVALRPTGANPGGAAVALASEGAGDAGAPVVATPYASVAPGDYALVDSDGADASVAGAPVSFEAGRAYTLILSDGQAPRVVVDSDLGPEALRRPSRRAP